MQKVYIKKETVFKTVSSPFTFYFFPIIPGTGYIKKGREFLPTFVISLHHSLS